MHHSHYWSGKKKGGFIHKIPEVGFSGIAGITWVAAVKTTYAKLKDGAQCVVTSHRLETTVNGANFLADGAKDRRYYTGRTTLVRFNVQ